jgi:hypothetical protein
VYLKFPPPLFGCLSVWERPESDLTPPVSNGVFWEMQPRLPTLNSVRECPSECFSLHRSSRCVDNQPQAARRGPLPFTCNTKGLDFDPPDPQSRAHRNEQPRIVEYFGRGVSIGWLFVVLHRVASHYVRARTIPPPPPFALIRLTTGEAFK